MRVAVVGGGLFGCTIAVDLARAGVQVDLYEARGDILDGTSDRVQARLHRGYHYPRSDSTAAAAASGYYDFSARWPEAVRHAHGGHYYVIAPDGRTSADEYLRFCQRNALPYAYTSHPMVYGADLVLQVSEALIDVPMLRRLMRRDLRAAGVDVHLRSRVDQVGEFDRVVWATYGQPWSSPLQYEVCELAIVELGRYQGQSFVVQDGDFVSLDPWRGLYALYDVKHSVHHASVGRAPEIPDEYADLIARPGLQRSGLTHVDAMLDSASRFLRAVEPRGRGVAIYHGSVYSVRAVLPIVDATDERPTLVRVDGNQISVLSGKMCTAVEAARRVTAIVCPSLVAQ